MEEKSFAMELLQDMKKQNKRMFTLLLVILVLWFGTICGFVWYVNQFDYVDTTEYTNTTDNGGNACIGDNCINGDSIKNN